MNPRRANAPRSMNAPTIRASTEASATARIGSVPAAINGKIVAAIIGPSAGIGSQDEDPGRPEHRVGEQAHDRGVQARDRRQARQLRVGHALGDEQAGEHQPGDQVLGQPRALVCANGDEAGDVHDPRIAPRHGQASEKPGADRHRDTSPMSETYHIADDCRVPPHRPRPDRRHRRRRGEYRARGGARRQGSRRRRPTGRPPRVPPIPRRRRRLSGLCEADSRAAHRPRSARSPAGARRGSSLGAPRRRARIRGGRTTRRRS